MTLSYYGTEVDWVFLKYKDLIKEKREQEKNYAKSEKTQAMGVHLALKDSSAQEYKGPDMAILS